MKLKESKETQEVKVKQDEKSNPVHEYLDFVSYGVRQLNVLQTNKNVKLCVHVPYVDFNMLGKLFNWEDTKEQELIYKGTFADYVSLAYDVCTEWIDRYNELAKNATAYEMHIISLTLPHITIVADIVQAYRDLNDDEEAAKKKWCKCESH